MLKVKCPYCGTRDISEFSCHGEAHIPRPTNTHKLSEKQWGDYVFFRTNTKGVHADRWMHAAGCRQWFNMLRNTATDEIIETYKIGDKPKSGKNNGKR